MKKTINAEIMELVAGIADAAFLIDGQLPVCNNTAESALKNINNNCQKILSLLKAVEIIGESELDVQDLFIDEVTALIKRNICDFNFDANSLASMMSTSLVTLNRKVKKAVGCTTTAYIRRLRLEKAKLLLERSDASVTEIHALCGFDMLSYFSRLFKGEFGVSPMRYRSVVRKV